MKKRVSKQLALAVAVSTLLVSSGCSKKEQALPQPVQPKTVAAKPPQPVQAQASSAKTAAGVERLLDFTGKKDPFKPFAPEQVQAAPRVEAKKAEPVRTGELLPIQSYEVTKFKVAGIIAGLKENSALIVDPAGKGYVVKQGMMIGSNDGRINRITPAGIEVIEQYRDDNGHLRKRSIILTLPKKK